MDFKEMFLDMKNEIILSAKDKVSRVTLKKINKWDGTWEAQVWNDSTPICYVTAVKSGTFSGSRKFPAKSKPYIGFTAKHTSVSEEDYKAFIAKYTGTIIKLLQAEDKTLWAELS